MTLYDLASYIVDHYECKAPGGETPLWEDFRETSCQRYGVGSPFEPEAKTITVSDKYVADWLELYRMALEATE